MTEFGEFSTDIYSLKIFNKTENFDEISTKISNACLDVGMPRKEDAAGAVAVSFLIFERRMNYGKDYSDFGILRVDQFQCW